MRYVVVLLFIFSCAGLIKEEMPAKRDLKDNTPPKEVIVKKENRSMDKVNGNIKSYLLENGMRLIVEEDHSAPVVAVQAWVRVGSADESDEIAGVAHLHEHMLFKGTSKRGVGEIAKIIEENGGDINAWTSFDDTVYHIVMPSSKVDMGLDIITDVIMNSSFDAKELAREKEVVLEELRQNRDIPQRRIIDEVFALSYQVHPYKRPVIGYVDSVKRINRQKILEFYKRFYVPSNIIMVVAGDVRGDEVYLKIQNLVKGFTGVAPEIPRPQEPVQTAPRVKIIKDRFVEAQIGIAWHISDIKDEDTPAIDLLSILLGSSQSSKLRETIVVDKTLATDIFAYSYTPRDKGLFIVGAGLPFVNVPAALKEIFDIVLRYKYEKFSFSEVNKAIVQVESDDIFSLTTMQGRARKLGFYQMMTGDINFGKRYLDRIRSITPEDLYRVARKYLTYENMSVVILLPDTAQDGLINEDQVLKAYRDAEEFYNKRERESEGKREIYRKVLKNGITLIVEQNSRLPIVSVRAASLGGVRFEDEKTSGISYFISRMLTRGNSSMNTFQIMRSMDNIGGSINGFAGKNSLGIRAEFLSKYLDTGMKILLDCLFNSTFADQEIEKERRLILEEIKSREDDLTFQALHLFLNTLYTKHPYRYDILGSESSISRLTKEELLSFYRRVIVPENVVISVVGDVEPYIVEQMIEEGTEGIKKTGFKPIKLESESPPSEVKRAVVYKEKEQAHIVIGFLGTTMFDRDRYALELLSVILGGQSGRLFLDLRDKRSLAYTVSSFQVDGLENGYFAIYLSCSQHKIKTAESAVFESLEQVKKGGVSKDELDKAKNYLIGIHSIEMQEYSNRAFLYSLDELYGLGYDFHRKYIEMISSVSLEDINNVLQKYIDPSKAVIAIVRSQAK
jgi:zinc protease